MESVKKVEIVCKYGSYVVDVDGKVQNNLWMTEYRIWCDVKNMDKEESGHQGDDYGRQNKGDNGYESWYEGVHDEEDVQLGDG